MKVLVTGYSGRLGRYVGALLAEKGHTVRSVLHATAVRRDSVPAGFEVVWGDLTRPATVEEALRGVDAVIHTAWIWPHQAAGDESINRKVLELLWEGSIKNGVSRFAVLSSVAVYGMTRKEREPLGEEASYASGSEAEFDYPKQKIEVEKYLQEQPAGERPQICILRPGIFFDDTRGPGKTMKIGGLRFGLGVGSGRNRVPLIHIADVADASVRWIEAGDGDCVYNVTPSRCLASKEWGRSWRRLNNVHARHVAVPKFVMMSAAYGATMLKKVLGKKASTKGAKYALAAATRDIAYANDALKRDLGWVDASTARYYPNES